MHKITVEFDTRHGSPYDRGAADSFYRRPFNPHYFKGDTGSSEQIVLENMTPEEIVAYTKGFNNNEALGDHKEW